MSMIFLTPRFPLLLSTVIVIAISIAIISDLGLVLSSALCWNERFNQGQQQMTIIITSYYYFFVIALSFR